MVSRYGYPAYVLAGIEQYFNLPIVIFLIYTYFFTLQLFFTLPLFFYFTVILLEWDGGTKSIKIALS